MESKTSAVESELSPAPSSFPSLSIPPQASAGIQALLDDVTQRPQYYVNISGVFVGLILLIVVLEATMVALDGFPFVADSLRVVGLGYVFWFLGKFLFNGGERRRLNEEIAEFVDIIKGEGIEERE